jgi:hypothetical protein
VGVGFITALTAQAQNAALAPSSELGAESENWGLTPFAAVPTIALRPEDRTAIRALEDQHIKERRAFEDKYETELRRLIRKQADERDALRTRLSAPRQ